MIGRLSDLLHPARWHFTDAVCGVGRRREDELVSLTFDDGPHPGTTDAVLDILADLDVKATFFCVGSNALAHPELARRITAQGHAIGSHSYTHPYPQVLDPLTVHAEYAAGRRAVETAVGGATALFRPPHGHVRLWSAGTLRMLRLRTWLWSVDPEDWRPGARTQQIVTDVARAEGGDVILLHDWVEQPLAPEALDRSATIAALPEIVAVIRDKGLRFERLS